MTRGTDPAKAGVSGADLAAMAAERRLLAGMTRRP